MRSRPIIRSSYLDPEVAAHLSEIELCGAFLYTNVRQKSFSAGTEIEPQPFCNRTQQVARLREQLIVTKNESFTGKVLGKICLSDII